MRGNFILPDQGLIIPNIIPDEGEQAYAKILFQGDNVIVPAAGNFYLGLCGENVLETLNLTTLVGEPGVVNGYARKAITRDATGWPTISQINGKYRALSKVVVFIGSGGAFDTAITRFFLCNVASGTSGLLLAISGPLAVAKTVANSETYNVQYEVFIS